MEMLSFLGRATRDVPGGPVMKTPSFYCSGHGFDLWWGNQEPTYHEAWPKNRGKKGPGEKETSWSHEASTLVWWDLCMWWGLERRRFSRGKRLFH